MHQLHRLRDYIGSPETFCDSTDVPEFDSFDSESMEYRDVGVKLSWEPCLSFRRVASATTKSLAA